MLILIQLLIIFHLFHYTIYPQFLVVVHLFIIDVSFYRHSLITLSGNKTNMKVEVQCWSVSGTHGMIAQPVKYVFLNVSKGKLMYYWG